MAWQVCPHGIEELIKVAFDLYDITVSAPHPNYNRILLTQPGAGR
jgi:NAD(P)H-nitrite reductase large subunit